MRNIHIAQLPRYIGRRTPKRISRGTIGAPSKQHTRGRQQRVHRTGVQRSDAALIGMLQIGARIEQHGH